MIFGNNLLLTSSFLFRNRALGGGEGVGGGISSYQKNVVDIRNNIFSQHCITWRRNVERNFSDFLSARLLLSIQLRTERRWWRNFLGIASVIKLLFNCSFIEIWPRVFVVRYLYQHSRPVFLELSLYKTTRPLVMVVRFALVELRT